MYMTGDPFAATWKDSMFLYISEIRHVHRILYVKTDMIYLFVRLV